MRGPELVGFRSAGRSGNSSTGVGLSGVVGGMPGVGLYGGGRFLVEAVERGLPNGRHNGS